MPELHFKGKEYVFNHHLTVPHRPLVAHPDKSVSANPEDEDRQGGAADGNLIIHGDNLHALKALLPRYAGKVDCIFIDPPYNTGNESWNYNDNVNSPILREWLDGNPVNKEDMLRHDKWCCMMYPRVKLLHELLAEHGSFWMTLDDNEIHRSRMIMDEIFGEESFAACIEWQHSEQGKGYTDVFSVHHNHILVYGKPLFKVLGLKRLEEHNVNYSNPDNDPKGDWRLGDVRNSLNRDNLKYNITTPSGKTITPPKKGWRWKYETLQKKIDLGEIRFVENETKLQRRIYLRDQERRAAETIWFSSEVGTTRDANAELKRIFGVPPLETVKPVKLIQRILEIAIEEDGLVLDSFAGSGTTAHAVLSENVKDGGNRQFILVECEDYADQVTAERVRRVINGYKFQGTQKEELLRKKITWSNFSGEQAHRKILDQVQSIRNLDSGNFDEIKRTIKDGELIVTGEKKIADKAEGLGGGFTYYTLGDPLDLDKMLTGESLPDYASIGAWLFHTATGEPLNHEGIRENNCYLGESAAFHVWLIYRADRDFLKSRDSALTLDFAKAIAKDKNKRHLVFASSRFVSNKTLSPLGVEFAPLPFALYRLEKE